MGEYPGPALSTHGNLSRARACGTGQVTVRAKRGTRIFSHIYIYWYLLIAQVADFILVVTLSMQFFFIEIPDDIFKGGETGCPISGIFCLRKTDNTLLVYLIK